MTNIEEELKACLASLPEVGHDVQRDRLIKSIEHIVEAIKILNQELNYKVDK